MNKLHKQTIWSASALRLHGEYVHHEVLCTATQDNERKRVCVGFVHSAHLKLKILSSQLPMTATFINCVCK